MAVSTTTASPSKPCSRTRRRDVEAVVGLGDMGGFGPHPNRVFPLLCGHRVQAIQGTYDASVASGRTDRGGGYTDLRDNHFVRISFEYTFTRTSAENRCVHRRASTPSSRRDRRKSPFWVADYPAIPSPPIPATRRPEGEGRREP